MHVDLETLKRRVRLNEARIEALTYLGLIPDPMRKLSDITDSLINDICTGGAGNEPALP